MIRFQPLPAMSVLAILALAMLLALGRWQWEKYERKIDAADEPVAETMIADYQPIPEGIQFVYGVRADTREQGWRIFTPVQFGESVVFVDADFFPGARAPRPEEARPPPALRLGAPIVGATIHPGEPGPFTAPPNLLQRRWHAVNLQRMARNAGLDNVADYYIAADYVGADGRATDNPFALPPGADPLPAERHLGYAITWFGLALVLLVIYFAYHRSVGRLSLAPPRARQS